MKNNVIKQKKTLVEMFKAGYISSTEELNILLEKSNSIEINNYIKKKLKLFERR